MPQLQIGDFAPQLIWLAITFVTLYLIMARVALPRIGSVLREREKHIADDLAEAQRLKDQTSEAIAAYEQALAEARSKANAIANQTREELNAKLNAERAVIDQQIASKTAAAEARIQQIKENALGQIHEIAGETAQAVVDKLIGAKVTQKDVAATVAQYSD